MSAPASVFTLLDAVTSDTTGASTLILAAFTALAFQVSGSGTYNYDIEVSLDGSAWNSAAHGTGPSVGKVDAYPYIRAKVSGYSNGTITVKAIALA